MNFKNIFIIGVFIFFVVAIIWIWDIHFKTDQSIIDGWSLGHFAMWFGIGVLLGSYSKHAPQHNIKILGITISIIALLFIITVSGIAWEFFEQLGWGHALGIAATPESIINCLGDLVINITGFCIAYVSFSKED